MSAAPVLSAPNLRVAAPGWLTAAIIIATVM